MRALIDLSTCKHFENGPQVLCLKILLPDLAGTRIRDIWFLSSLIVLNLIGTFPACKISEWCSFLPKASFGLRVLSLPVSVCVCINHLLVRTITRHLFKLGSPNLVQRSKTPWLRSLLFWGAIDLDLQGQI